MDFNKALHILKNNGYIISESQFTDPRMRDLMYDDEYIKADEIAYNEYIKDVNYFMDNIFSIKNKAYEIIKDDCFPALDKETAYNICYIASNTQNEADKLYEKYYG